jgi:fructokinase
MYLVCGEALYDFFLTDSADPGALTFDARAAGSPFNTAIGIVRQGGQSALFTGV